jgi:hypothetical protein
MNPAEKAYSAFAAERGLKPLERYEVGPVTPLLADVYETDLEPAVQGALPGGVEGVVGHLAYRLGSSFHFNLALTGVPVSTAFVPRLICTRRHRVVRSDEWNAFDVRQSRLWTESTALDRRYEITAAPYQDPIWLRRLFSPEFVDWLASEPPPDFSFELAYGLLVGSVEENYPGLAAFDALCEATAHVAEHVRSECEE